MSFIRPEIAAGLYRWREVIIMGVVIALGVYLAASGFGFMRLVGGGFAMIGLGLMIPAYQRARFRAGSGGLGVVDVDERQVTYFAPIGGGAISLDALVRVEIGPDRSGFGVWRLIAPDETLIIPCSAEGTGALFDAIAGLTGADVEGAIRVTKQSKPDDTVIWTGNRHRLH
ncbi:MAG: hypothetical protein ACRBCL_04380 [Maritimibacter sp.]